MREKDLIFFGRAWEIYSFQNTVSLQKFDNQVDFLYQLCLPASIENACLGVALFVRMPFVRMPFVRMPLVRITQPLQSG
jgi:hypothetical protein